MLTFTGLTEDDRQTVYDEVVKVANQACADLQAEVGGQPVADRHVDQQAVQGAL